MITLRAPEPADLDNIYLWENLEADAHTSFASGPLSRHQIAQYLDDYVADISTTGSQRYMIVADGKTVGTVDLFDYNSRTRSAFVGVYVAESFRRCGYATQALNEVCRLAGARIGLNNIAALVAADNEASLRLFSRCGFVEAGRLRSWLPRGRRLPAVDAVILQRRL